MNQCKICQKYHEEKHPYQKLQTKFRKNAKKLNKGLTKEKRSLAAHKGWLKRKHFVTSKI